MRYPQFCCGTHWFPEGWKGQMRLSGRGVRCVRGGREVFSGLDFEVCSGEASPSPAPTDPARHRCCGWSLAFVVAGGSIDLAGGEAELTLPNRPIISAPRRPKARSERARKPVVLAGFSRRRGSDGAESLASVGLDHAAHLPAAYLSAGQRRRLSVARLSRPAAGLAAGRADLRAGCCRDRACSPL